VSQEVARWRRQIDEAAASLQSGGALDRELAEAEQQRAAAEQQIAALQQLRERRIQQVAAAREVFAQLDAPRTESRS